MPENLIVKKASERIQYVDALRGFTMILVVFAHVETFGFFDFSYETFVGKLFQVFRMPLFFFISGFIACKVDRIWTGDVVWQLTKKKMQIQIIPALLIGLVYTYAYLQKDIMFFISDASKAGYWFTLSLLEMFLIYYMVSWGSHEISKRSNISECYVSAGLLICTAVIFFLLKLPFKILPILDTIGNYTSCHYTFNYFMFFVFGVLARQHTDCFEKLITNKYISALSIVLFGILFYAFYLLGHTVNCGDVVWKVILTVMESIIAFLGIVIVYSYFRKYSHSFETSNPLGCSLQFIGRRTLDIYLLHYFFLPHLPKVGSFLISTHNVVIELLIGLGLSLLIIAICLCLSNVIRISPFLGKYLFGAKE